MRPLILVILSCLAFASVLGQTKTRESNWLVFEGTVMKIGRAPSVVCGVTAPYRIAKYKIEKIHEGRYDKADIVVHHLFCRTDVLEDLKDGDRVLVMIDLRSPPAQVSPDGDILKSEDRLKKYYAAKRVAKVTTCCDF